MMLNWHDLHEHLPSLGRRIGLGSKSGSDGFALGGCEHPEITNSLYVCLCALYWKECIAFGKLLKGLHTLKWLRTTVWVFCSCKLSCILKKQLISKALLWENSAFV